MKGLIFHLTGFFLEMPQAMQLKRDTLNPGVQTLDLGIWLIYQVMALIIIMLNSGDL